MARRRTKKKPVWPKILMFVISCLAVGALIALLNTNGRFSMRSLMPWTARAEVNGNEGLDAMSRNQLEREVARLRKRLAETERENANLIVQMKLLDEGSRTGD